MQRVLITGISGTGKSSVIAALADRGYVAVDTDEACSIMVAAPEGELTGPGDGQDWIWDEERIQRILDDHTRGTLFLGGCAPNQGRFYPQLDHIVLLSAPAELMAERLMTRTNNPFGKRPDELERSLALKDEIEPRLRATANLEVDTSLPLEEVVSVILRHVEAPAPPGE